MLIEQAPVIGSNLGPSARPDIEEALAACGVEVVTNTAVSSIEANRVTTSSGRILDTDTAVWTTIGGQSPSQAPASRRRPKLRSYRDK